MSAELVQRLAKIARDEKLNRVQAIITSDNLAMQHLAQKMGARLAPTSDGKVKAEIDLS